MKKLFKLGFAAFLAALAFSCSNLETLKTTSINIRIPVNSIVQGGSSQSASRAVVGGGVNDPSEIYELKIALNVDGKDFVQSAQGTTEELSAKVFTFSDLEVSAEVFARCDVLEDNELIWSGKSEPIVISEGTNDIEIMMKKVQQDEPPVEEHEHTFSEDWTSDETRHWHAATCEHTSEVSGKAVHTWNEGEVTKNATEEDDGEKTFTCTVCGRTKTEVIIALNHVHTISESWSSDETHHLARSKL